MATLGGEIHVCTVDSNQFLGVREGRNKDEILVTDSRVTATIYEVYEKKPTMTFNTRRGMTFQTSVVYCPKHERFVGALDNKEIRTWISSKKDDCVGQKVVVPYEVHSLWVASSNCDPLIVCKNGSIAQLTDMVTFEVLVDRKEGDVSCIRVTVHTKVTHVAYLLKTTMGFECHYYTFSQGKMFKLDQFISELQESSGVPKDLLLNCVHDKVDLLLLRDDGSLEIGAPQIPTKDISWKLSNITGTISSEYLSAVVALQGVLLVACQKSDDIEVSVHNIKYGAIVSKKNVKIAKKLSRLEFHLVQGRFFLVAEKDLYTFSLVEDTLDLSSVIGSKHNVTGEPSVLSTKFKWTSEGLTEKVDKTKNALDSGKYTPRFCRLVKSKAAHGTTDYKACGEVISELIAKAWFKELKSVLTYYKDIPEKGLVQILSHYLGHMTDDHKIANKTKKLKKVLNIPFNDVFIKGHLKMLSSEATLCLLRCLHTYIKEFEFMKDSNWKTATQHVDWINVLLDAQFSCLAMSNDETVHSLLHELQSTVDSHNEFLENLGTFQELLWITQSRTSLQSNTDDLPYCIKTLHLPLAEDNDHPRIQSNYWMNNFPLN